MKLKHIQNIFSTDANATANAKANAATQVQTPCHATRLLEKAIDTHGTETEQECSGKQLQFCIVDFDFSDLKTCCVVCLNDVPTSLCTAVACGKSTPTKSLFVIEKKVILL